MGKSAACISGWENGRTEPRITDLKNLAIILSVKPSWLMAMSDEKEEKEMLETGEVRDPVHLPLRNVPLLDLRQLEVWDIPENNIELVQTTSDYKLGDAAAFIVNTDAVAKLTVQGDTAIVERIFRDTHNDVHLIRVKGKSGAATLRRYKVDGDTAIYVADSAEYMSYKAKEVDVIGRVCEIIRRTAL